MLDELQSAFRTMDCSIERNGDFRAPYVDRNSAERNPLPTTMRDRPRRLFGGTFESTTDWASKKSRLFRIKF
jgi:hypothetical protein